MENIVKLRDFVPFFQTLSWILFISVMLLFYRRSIHILIESLVDRVKNGSSFKAGPFEIGALLDTFPSTEKMQKNIKPGADGIEREKHRVEIYKKNKGLFLTHVFVPSKKKDYRDIYVFLTRHNSKDFSDIKYVEFFFGHMWGYKVFKIENENKNGLIGITTSAYYPFLCTCCIKFTDGSERELYRYIDFEMKQNGLV